MSELDAAWLLEHSMMYRAMIRDVMGCARDLDRAETNNSPAGIKQYLTMDLEHALARLPL